MNSMESDDSAAAISSNFVHSEPRQEEEEKEQEASSADEDQRVYLVPFRYVHYQCNYVIELLLLMLASSIVWESVAGNWK